MATANLPDITEIEESFEFLDDWEDRFEYLLELGRKLPAMPEAERTEPNRVHGCQASVWMTMEIEGGEVRLQAVSDAHIVNGLIAILMSLYNGKPPREAVGIDAESLFKRLGLEEHLSPTRRNGLHSMVQRIRSLARQHDGSTP